MGQVFMWKYFVGIFLLGVCLTEITAQITDQDVVNIIDREWNNEVRRQRMIDDIIYDLDIGERFKDLTGITLGAAVAILIVVIIIPNLVILLVIFTFCYCCQCGVFQKPKSTTNFVHHQPQTYAPSPAYAPQASKPVGPAVPPKPQHNYSPSPPPSSGMWPWGKEDGNQQQGIQNQGYNSQY
ncbi:uncharacterized protein LOC110852366 isoform X2 [Folsomia candida]|uniref:uncharacterized protein LOC110852366 isoform X2 n=1 Tax=Folsomia candida TaxID=158441 RepID=UPI000B8F8DE7|nr:uncharacterized protein LOC110852366 isoform X2 [Folsomia candida]